MKKNKLKSDLILKIFNNSINDVSGYENKELEGEYSIEDLIYFSFYTNKKLWDLEDCARIHEKGSDYIAKTKKLIDENNGIRNKITKKIDKNIFKSLDLISNPKTNFYSESPGMIIDRLGILFIKFLEVKKISKIIEEKSLKDEYLEKENLITKQIEELTNFLDNYLTQLENKEVYFSVHDSVKIYNDERVKKYIQQLKEK